MATMMIAGERYEMPVWLKARLLQVTPAEDNAHVLIVESGSERGKTYPVEHDGEKSTHCPCRAVTQECAHRIAADRFLAAAQVLGPEIAQDLTAHVEDDLTSHEEEYAELAAEAEAIIAAEYEARVQAEIAALPDADSDAMDEVYAMQDVPQVPGSCDMCGRWSKRAVCAWCAGVAA